MHDESAQNVLVTANIIHEMIDRGLFRLESIVIPMTLENSLLAMDLHLVDNRMKPGVGDSFPISGFPRRLSDDEALKRASKCNNPRLRTIRELIFESFPTHSQSPAPKISHEKTISPRKTQWAEPLSIRSAYEREQHHLPKPQEDRFCK